MKVVDKSNKDEPVHLPFDAAMDALATGAVEPHAIEGERGPDQPAAQMPKPGTDPVGGKEELRDGEALTNLAPAGVSDTDAPGLPKEPAAPASTLVTPKPAPVAKADEKKADDKKA